jgi:hypothetical protein
VYERTTIVTLLSCNEPHIHKEKYRILVNLKLIQIHISRYLENYKINLAGEATTIAAINVVSMANHNYHETNI